MLGGRLEDVLSEERTAEHVAEEVPVTKIVNAMRLQKALVLERRSKEGME